MLTDGQRKRARRTANNESDSDSEEERALEARLAALKNRRKPNENEPPPAAEAGILTKVECVNFMCHDNLVVELDPFMNFIVGNNGSGKSAVLTALILCLGGKAASTNRAANLKNLIKTDKEYVHKWY